MQRSCVLVNLLPLVVLGCGSPETSSRVVSPQTSAGAAPAAAPTATTAPARFTSSVRVGVAALPTTLRSARPTHPALPSAAPPARPATSSPVRALVNPLEGATFDRTRGAAITALVEGLPEERRKLGIAGLGRDQLFGNCESPYVTAPIEGGYEIGFDVEPFVWISPPERALIELSPACVQALTDAGGDVRKAVNGDCEPSEREAFFPSGSACRTCLEVDGDFARCVGDGECPQQGTRHVLGPNLEGGNSWVPVLSARALACAPDHEVPTLLLVPGLEDDDPLLRPFEHGISASCIEVYDADDGTSLSCSIPEFAAHAYGDVALTRIEYLSPAGAPDGGLAGRMMVASEVEVDGTSWGHSQLYESTLGSVSQSFDTPFGWGIELWEPHPGGGDRAREILAAWAVKTATTRDGVPVHPINHNRCEAWSSPDSAGASTCERMGSWSESGLLDDGGVLTYDFYTGEIYVIPFLTVVSNGLPDPELPGGVVIHALGSTALQDLEGCNWPGAFEPDRLRMLDSTPVFSPEPYASFDGQTWRFDREPELGIVMGITTTQLRGYCSTALTPVE